MVLTHGRACCSSGGGRGSVVTNKPLPKVRKERGECDLHRRGWFPGADSTMLCWVQKGRALEEVPQLWGDHGHTMT